MFFNHFPFGAINRKSLRGVLSALTCMAVALCSYADDASYVHFQLKSSDTPDTYEFRKIHKLSFDDDAIRVHLHENGEIIEYPIDNFAGTTFTTPTSAITDITADNSGISYLYDHATGVLTISAEEPIDEILVVNLMGQVYVAYSPKEKDCTVTFPETAAHQTFIIKILTGKHSKTIKIIR